MPDAPASAPSDIAARVRAKLAAALAPARIEIRDRSAAHAGHREARGRSHLAVRVVSPRFEGLTAAARHRMVYAALAEELAGPVHALAIRAETPQEAARSR